MGVMPTFWEVRLKVESPIFDSRHIKNKGSGQLSSLRLSLNLNTKDSPSLSSVHVLVRPPTIFNQTNLSQPARANTSACNQYSLNLDIFFKAVLFLIGITNVFISHIFQHSTSSARSILLELLS